MKELIERLEESADGKKAIKISLKGPPVNKVYRLGEIIGEALEGRRITQHQIKVNDDEVILTEKAVEILHQRPFPGGTLKQMKQWTEEGFLENDRFYKEGTRASARQVERGDSTGSRGQWRRLKR